MELKVSSPCPMSWDRMAGDDRVRYCGKCRLSVYNLTQMSPEEVGEAVRSTGGRLCGRLYVRGDRTATPENCPSAAMRRRKNAFWAAAALMILGSIAWAFRAWEPDRSTAPPWVKSFLEWADPQPQPPRILMGKIVCPMPPPPPPVPPAPPEKPQ
jgi:hypothetical protein